MALLSEVAVVNLKDKTPSSDELLLPSDYAEIGDMLSGVLLYSRHKGNANLQLHLIGRTTFM
jgi:hypothetical protein